MLNFDETTDPRAVAQLERCMSLEEGSRGALMADSHLGYCVPEAGTEILTKRGWLTHDRVQVGDYTLGYDASGSTKWTRITDIYHGVHETIELSHSHWRAEVTRNHRWLTSRRHWKRRTEHSVGVTVETCNLNAETFVLLSAPYAGGESDITPQEAAIIGWIITDGHTMVSSYTNGERKVELNIFQSKPAGRALLEKTLVGVPHTTHSRMRPRTNYRSHQYRLRTPYACALWDKSGLHHTTLEDFVLSLNTVALRAFVEAVIMAEGTKQPNGHIVIAQNVGPKFDAIALSVWLLGYRASVAMAASDTHDPWKD